MSTLGKIVYLSEAQASELFANGSITVDGTTITYSANDLYLTPENIDYVQKSGDTMSGTLATPRLNIVSNSIPVLWYMSDDTTDAGQVGLRLSDKRYFIGYRNNANKNIYFSLPPLSSDNTSESTWYDILTTKGNYAMTGTLTAAAPITSYHSTTPSFAYKTGASGTLIAESAARAGTRQIFFREYASDTAYHEDYLLPEHTTNATGNAIYNIVTTKGSYTMSGALTAKTLQTYNRGDNYASLSFKNTTTGSDNAAMNCYLSNNRVFITEYSPGTTYVERFYLPAPDSSRTASADYNILTTKSPVTVAQGGTGDAGIVAGTLENVNSNITVQSETRLRRWGRVVNFSFHITLSASIAAYTPLFYFPTGFRPSEVYNTFLRSAASDTDAAIYKTYTYSAGAYTCRAALPAGPYLGELTMLI